MIMLVLDVMVKLICKNPVMLKKQQQQQQPNDMLWVTLMCSDYTETRSHTTLLAFDNTETRSHNHKSDLHWLVVPCWYSFVLSTNHHQIVPQDQHITAVNAAVVSWGIEAYIFQLFQSATCFILGGTLKWRGRHRKTGYTCCRLSF